MDKSIEEYIGQLSVGETTTHQNMAVTPIFGPTRDLDYLVFDEAIRSGLKISETGNVGSLTVLNATGKEVLILQGEYVVGGYQNRMIAQNAYLAKDFTGQIPVNCVQQGRWTTHIPKVFNTSENMAPRTVAYAAFRGQGAVWNEVQGISASLNFHSPTQDYDEVRRYRGSDANELANHFQYTPGAVGVVIVNGDGQQRFTVDLFDQSRTLEKNFSKLIKAAAMEAVATAGSIGSHNPQNMLLKVVDAQATTRKPVSLGIDYHIDGGGIEGSALLHKGKPVYVSFGSANGGSTTPLPHLPSTGYRRPNRPWVAPRPCFPDVECDPPRWPTFPDVLTDPLPPGSYRRNWDPPWTWVDGSTYR